MNGNIEHIFNITIFYIFVIYRYLFWIVICNSMQMKLLICWIFQWMRRAYLSTIYISVEKVKLENKTNHSTLRNSHPSATANKTKLCLKRRVGWGNKTVGSIIQFWQSMKRCTRRPFRKTHKMQKIWLASTIEYHVLTISLLLKLKIA